MGTEPLISIGIPTYNRAAGIKKTLDSIFSQSYKNLEIIVSDNASTDPEVKIVLEKYSIQDKRVKVYTQKENIGMVRNFNYVAEVANGEYFMWKADDDVISDENYISKLYEFVSNNDLDFGFTECIFNRPKQESKKMFCEIYKNCNSNFDYLNSFISKSFACLEFYGLYNRKRFLQNGGSFQLDVTVNCPDIIYLPKLFLNSKVGFCPDIEYEYIHEASEDSYKRTLTIFQDRRKLLKELFIYIQDSNSISNEEKKIVLSNLLNYFEAIIIDNYNKPFSHVLKEKVKSFLGWSCAS